MNAFDLARARRNHPGKIVMTVVKDGHPKLIVIPPERAAEKAKFVNWTMADLDGVTVILK